MFAPELTSQYFIFKQWFFSYLEKIIPTQERLSKDYPKKYSTFFLN